MWKKFNKHYLKSGHMLLSYKKYKKVKTKNDIIKSIVVYNPTSIALEKNNKIRILKYRRGAWNKLKIKNIHEPLLDFYEKEIIIAVLIPIDNSYINKFVDLSGYSPVWINKDNEEALDLYYSFASGYRNLTEDIGE